MRRNHQKQKQDSSHVQIRFWNDIYQSQLFFARETSEGIGHHDAICEKRREENDQSNEWKHI